MAFISSEHKKKMYKSERMAIIGVLVICVVIGVALIIGLNGNNKKRTNETDTEQGSEDINISGDITVDDSAETSGADVGVDAHIDFTTVKVDNTTVDEGALILVNYEHKYNAEDISDDLINVYAKYSDTNFVYSVVSLRLYDNVAQKLDDMCVGFKKDMDNYGLILKSAYVSSEEQEKIYNKNSADATAEELFYLQAAGYSEHQTGLAFDLSPYPSSDERYEWFVNHCWEYGFIIRYPEGKENVTL